MISQKEMLNIICTEAIEHGGLQEIPGQQHGGKTSFHAAKRLARKTEEHNPAGAVSGSPKIKYRLKLIRKSGGKFQWKD